MAWVVEKNLIQYMVAVGMGMELEYVYKGEVKTIDSPNDLGNELFDANKTSVAVLDDQRGWFKELGGEDQLKYNFGSEDDIEPIYETNLAQTYKSCICYECQANEFNDWKNTEAKAFIDALKLEIATRIICELPAYEKANFGSGQLVTIGNVG